MCCSLNVLGFRINYEKVVGLFETIWFKHWGLFGLDCHSSPINTTDRDILSLLQLPINNSGDLP